MSSTNFTPGTTIRASWLNDVNNVTYTLPTATGANLVGFTQTGVGATLRNLGDRAKDSISVMDFMSATQINNIRTGVPTDITAAAQAAIASATVFSTTIQFPSGNFRITAPLVTTMSGTRLIGASRYGTYITTATGTTFDLLRIAHQQCEVANFIFRPGGNQYCIRVYAGRAHIHDNYFLAATNNVGVAILLVDTDPDTAAFKAGAYVHTIDNNVIGDAGFAFESGIYDNTTAGIQACSFRENAILSNRPIQVNNGGANSYINNLFQSSQGVAGSTVGVGVYLGANVVGEKLFGNYFELFQAMINTNRADATYQIFYAVGNHNDACTTTVSDAGAKNYVFEDAAGKVINYNGWTTSYANTSWSITKSSKTAIAADTNGNAFLGGPTSGASHIINRASSTEGTVILNFQYNSTSMGYMQDARGTGINGANTLLALNKNSSTNRSINAAGTVNTSGADYAEYMIKADDCATVAKGQIIGINGEGKITDKWDNAVAFAIKSTNPSVVGGDNWAEELGSRPVDNPEELEAYNVALEALRQKVDRIAYCGQVPVNVYEATPGQFIIPVKDGDGIAGIAVTSPTFDQYMIAVGKVIKIEPDGRAFVMVKIS